MAPPLGRVCVLEDGVRVFHPETVTIGDHGYVGQDTILNGDPRGRLRIGSGTWIGRTCAVLGAGAVVTTDLPARCVAAGVPARVLRMR